MTRTEAKEIITEYVFSDYKLESLYPIVKKNFQMLMKETESCMQSRFLPMRFRKLSVL